MLGIGKFTKVTVYVSILVFIAFIPAIGLPLVIFIIAYYLYKRHLNVFRFIRDVKEEYHGIMTENEDLK
jgi:hypothetical protein